MRRFLFSTLALAACGGTTSSPGQGHNPSSGPSGGASDGLVAEPPADAGPSPLVGFADQGNSPSSSIAQMVAACDTPDASRPATAAEHAQVCICTIESPMLPPYWVCYGPASSQAPQVQAKCSSLVYEPSEPDAGSESCLTLWEDCTTGGPYGVSCVDGFCQCLTNGKPSAILPPGSACSQSKADINAQCGWALQ